MAAKARRATSPVLSEHPYNVRRRIVLAQKPVGPPTQLQLDPIASAQTKPQKWEEKVADAGQRRRHAPRPAIRLDDQTIFSEADFAFEVEEDDVAVRPRPVVEKLLPLDGDIGRARSWANLDRFSVDFDIAPLPSGLYCNEETFVGNGSLEQLTACMRSPDQQMEIVPLCSSNGIDLAWDMSPSTVGLER